MDIKTISNAFAKFSPQYKSKIPKIVLSIIMLQY